MDYAAFILIGCLAIASVSYYLVRLEVRASREVLQNVVRHETDRLTHKVDKFVEANASSNLFARHAVMSAERAEKASERSAERAERASERPPVVVVVSPGGLGSGGDGGGGVSN